MDLRYTRTGMIPYTFCRRLGLILASLSLAACGSQDGAKLPGEVSENAPIFSAEDREAARALSIGTVSTMEDDATGPYGQALLCAVALDAVISRLGEGEGGEIPQIATLKQAHVIYVQRANRLGRELGKSSLDIKTDGVERARKVPEMRDRAVTAIGCLRGLS